MPGCALKSALLSFDDGERQGLARFVVRPSADGGRPVVPRLRASILEDGLIRPLHKGRRVVDRGHRDQERLRSADVDPAIRGPAVVMDAEG